MTEKISRISKEPLLPKDELVRESYLLFSEYKAVLMKSPWFQKATVLYFLGEHEQTPFEKDTDTREIDRALDRKSRLRIRYSPKENLSVELRTDQSMEKVLIALDRPLIKWSYENSEENKKIEFKNTKEAVGNCRHLLNQLRIHLLPQV